MIHDRLGFAHGKASTGDSRQIIANTLSAWAGAATSGLIGFFLVPLLLLRVGKEVYGLTTLVGTVVGLTVLVDLGLRGALGRHLRGAVLVRVLGPLRLAPLPVRRPSTGRSTPRCGRQHHSSSLWIDRAKPL